MSGLNEAELFELAAYWQHCSLFAAPTIVKRLAAFARQMGDQPKGFETIVYGGAPMYVADVIDAHQALGPVLAQIYGQGESPMTITVLPRHLINDTAHPQWRQRLASVGFAQPMVEVSVRDAAGNELPLGMPGEVCVRGDVLMTAYWNNPEATAAALREGWLATGDVGYLDAQGLLTLLDRSKDLVISGGNNIYPREIEEVLLLHPAVDEVAVIGIPDPEWGEALVAYVVAAPDQPPPTAEMLEVHCLAHIARYKRPKVWRWVSALPKNNYGKVLKTELRERERQTATS
jgi:long-chain acyl-CoA synthetase